MVTEQSAETDTSPRVALLICGGGFMEESLTLLRQIRSGAHTVIFSSSDCASVVAAHLETPVQGTVTPFLLRSQSLPSALHALPVSFLQSRRLLRQYRPEAAVCVGSSLALPFFFAARTLGIATVFVESITRVTTPSRTGRILHRLGLADVLYVQWEEAAKAFPGATYGGSLL